MLDEMTRLGTVMGSPQFMSPEQAQGNTRQIGPHTDVYGLGATLYYVLTRQPPIAGRNALEIIGNIPSVDPVPPDSIDRTIPEHISLVVMKAIAKEPANRYPNMDMFGEDLDRVLSGRVPLAKLQAHSRLRDSSVMSTVRAVGSSILKSISTRFKGETKPNEAEPPLARADRK
jgi:serine/threonine protein kinase